MAEQCNSRAGGKRRVLPHGYAVSGDLMGMVLPVFTPSTETSAPMGKV